MQLIRMKAGSVNAAIFSWDQSLEEIILDIPVPSNTVKADVVVQFGSKFLNFRVGDTTIDQGLVNPIIMKESFWFFEEADAYPRTRLVRIVLAKAQPGKSWTRVFVDQSSNLSEGEELEARKKILLERFSKENPQFDFSQAQFEGTCVPDARSFMGGLTL